MFPPSVEKLIDLAVEEDLGQGDLTSQSLSSPAEPASAQLLAKEPLRLAGLALLPLLFGKIDRALGFTDAAKDGDFLASMQPFARIQGPLGSLLAAERIALNFLQRLSGIATLTGRYVDAVAGTRARICDTRKTLPGYRYLDKWAVRLGGGTNHRFNLGAGILIKDNHLAAQGQIGETIRKARAAAPHLTRVETELTSIGQVEEALAAGTDVVLLDNMTVDEVRGAIELIRGRVLVEVSGGINLDNVRAYAEAGPDLISIGALTHSVRAVDISLELDPS